MEAMTLNVSDSGASIVSRKSYTPGAVVHVVPPDVARDAAFRVVWARSISAPPDQASHPTRYRVGIELLEGQAPFWHPAPALPDVARIYPLTTPRAGPGFPKCP